MKRAVRQALSDFDAEAVIVSHIPHIRWACGFTGSRALVVQTKLKAHFLTDARYAEQARQEVRGAEVIVRAGPFEEAALEGNLLDGVRRVVFQADRMTVSDLEKWKAAVPSAEWIAAEGLLTDAVARKAPDEIEKLRRAQALSDEVFKVVLDRIMPGVSELDIAAEITWQHLRRGARRMSFDPIVAAGPQSALPHARPTGRKIEPGDLVLLDFGCILDGYASDMTRTVAVGDPGGEARRVYETVREAQRRAVDQTVCGMSGKEADGIARRVIAAASWGDRFAHSLGHGIGLEVHEAPRLSPRSDDVIPPGAAVTIEPGIYLPGKFGVRIEDTVVVRESGCERLGTTTRDLIVL